MKKTFLKITTLLCLVTAFSACSISQKIRERKANRCEMGSAKDCISAAMRSENKVDAAHFYGRACKLGDNTGCNKQKILESEINSK